MGNKAICNQYDFRMSSILKEGKKDSFEIKKEVIPRDIVMNIYNNKEGRITKGKYQFDYPSVVLKENGNIWMSDSQLEVESIIEAVAVARGDVLIGGLGIGLLPTFIKNTRSVRKIDIVELHQEVIDLVFHQIATSKMRVINDDIFHYLDTTNNKYDFIHIDIWSSITAPMKEIDIVKEKAQRCLKPNGIIWCWLQELYNRIKDKLPKEPIFKTNILAIHEPCLICGKKLRNDYAGLCMDCADDMGVSELFIGKNNAQRKNAMVP